MGIQTKLRYIAVHLPDGMREFISRHAEEQGYIVTADYVRDLLEKDLSRHYGKPIPLRIKRGRKDRQN